MADRVSSQFTANQKRLEEFEKNVERNGDNRNTVIEDLALDKYNALSSGVEGIRLQLAKAEFNAKLWTDVAGEMRLRLREAEAKEKNTVGRKTIEGYMEAVKGVADTIRRNRAEYKWLGPRAGRISEAFNVEQKVVERDIEELLQ